MARKAQIWISVIIYTLVAILAVVLILNTGLPILTEMKDRATFTRVKDVMLELDRHITDISRQGEGSQAAVSFEIRDGEVKFEDNQLVWEIDTKSKIISPRTSTVMGNLIVSSNANVKTIETQDTYLVTTTIKNDTFRANFSKSGSREYPVSYNTSQIINYIEYNGNKMDGQFAFSLNSDPSSASGTGYVEMVPSGNNSNLGSAKVIAHMNSAFGSYDLEFTLESYSDFLTVKIKNFEP